MTPGFEPLHDDPLCRTCIGLERLARRRGHRLTFVDETTDLFPRGRRVYVHPEDLDVAAMAPDERSRYRGPWFAHCLGRCVARPAFS